MSHPLEYKHRKTCRRSGQMCCGFTQQKQAVVPPTLGKKLSADLYVLYCRTGSGGILYVIGPKKGGQGFFAHRSRAQVANFRALDDRIHNVAVRRQLGLMEKANRAREMAILHRNSLPTRTIDDSSRDEYPDGSLSLVDDIDDVSDTLILTFAVIHETHRPSVPQQPQHCAALVGDLCAIERDSLSQSPTAPMDPRGSFGTDTTPSQETAETVTSERWKVEHQDCRASSNTAGQDSKNPSTSSTSSALTSAASPDTRAETFNNAQEHANNKREKGTTADCPAGESDGRNRTSEGGVVSLDTATDVNACVNWTQSTPSLDSAEEATEDSLIVTAVQCGRDQDCCSP